MGINRKKPRHPTGQLPNFDANQISSIVSIEQYLPTGHTWIHLLVTDCAVQKTLCCAQSLSRIRLFAIPWTVARQAPLSMEIQQARILEWVAMPSSRGFPDPGMEPRSPTLQADCLLSEPPGKPKNTSVGSLFLLQGNFPAQELNQGLLHCRQLLYQLSYQRSPSGSLSMECQKNAGKRKRNNFFLFLSFLR